MEIDFADTKLRKRCEVEKEAIRVWGKVGARKLSQRLAELEAAESLAVLFLLPAARCHALKGDRSGQFAVDLVHPRRLVFEPAQDRVDYMEGGVVQPERVTAVRILGIVDYHG